MSEQELPAPPKTGLMQALEHYDTEKVRLLAESIGRSESTVWNWKSGIRQPGKEMLLVLCARLGITPEEALALAGASGGQPNNTRGPIATPDANVLGVQVRREIHSMVRGRLKLLTQDEVMFVRLDGKPFELAQDAVLMVKEVLGDGHVIVARVLARPTAEEPKANGAGGSRAPLGRQHTGKERGIRRQPSTTREPRSHDEDALEQDDV